MNPNHKDDCDGKDWYYSGEGYNRVKVCACGAEDHAPDPLEVYWIKRQNKLMRDGHVDPE